MLMLARDQRTDAPPDAPAFPYPFARRHGALLRRAADGGLVCLHRRPIALATLLEAQRLGGADVRFEPLDEEAWEAALQADYREGAGDSSEIAAAAGLDLAALADSVAVDDLLDQRDDSPVIRLINALLLEAVRERASDVHLEVGEREVVVRFRVDGTLRDVVRPNRALAPLLVSRIKVMARLDIAEKRVPQDGRVTLRVGGHEIDVRVSTIPAQHGERVVMRILERGSARLDLPELGMDPARAAAFEALLSRPHGMLLVTGPTGSGKTTTLYAALNRLNDRRRNIMTVEDPVEYELDGVGQMQVNPRTDLSFARGLRAILRQDPDVIMVGEIRDQETAEVAVRASMTGHLVLATLHTNSAAGSVTRLIDMGIERYLLAPVVTGLLAQRLVRRLCPACRTPDRAGPADRELLNGAIAVDAPIFRAGGCAACNEGYRGRAGLYELVVIDDRLEALIHDGAAESALVEAARAGGPSLWDDGVAKAVAGVTSVEEVARVLREDG